MKGYKIVREDHTHHGLVYQKGLNIDQKPFRAEGYCVEGGMYFFTDIKDVVKWGTYENNLLYQENL